MTKKLPLAIIALTTFLTFINSKAKCEDYKTIVDDPRAIKNLTIHLDPFYCEVWTTNPTLGFGLRGEYHLGRLASFAFDFRTPYPGTDGQGRIHYDQDLPYPNLEPGGKRGLARFTYTEFGAELHVFDWTKSKSLKVVLASSTSGRTTTTTYIMVPGTKRKVLAARGGFSTIQTAFDVKDTHTSIKGYHGKDTLSFGSYQDTKGGSSVYTGYSNMTMVIMHAGISIKSITNLVIASDNYGRKGNRVYNDLYFDVMVAPVITFSDVMTANKATWELKAANLKRTGWRLGYSWKNSDKSYLSYKAEVGSRPGFLEPNYFLNLILGWTIPFNL